MTGDHYVQKTANATSRILLLLLLLAIVSWPDVLCGGGKCLATRLYWLLGYYHSVVVNVKRLKAVVMWVMIISLSLKKAICQFLLQAPQGRGIL